MGVITSYSIHYTKLYEDSKNDKIAKGADTLYDVCNAAAETMYKIVGGIMQYAPVGA